MRTDPYDERSSLHLQLRMHVLRELCRANETSFAQTAKVNLCGDRVAKSRLVPPPLMLDSIGEKTLVADRAHADQRAMDAGGQEFCAQAG